MNQVEKTAFKKRVLEGKSIFKPAWYLQTMHISFEEICRGEPPWTALGNFMHQWYGRDPDCRPKLLADPLSEMYPPEFSRWAAFCTASARWFCSTYEISCPTWVDDPRYVLSEPWYLDHPSSSWPYLRKTTAEEFSQHNIYCGNSLYTNKYERDERGIPFQAHPIDLQERRGLVRAAAARLECERTAQKRRMGERPLIRRSRV